LQRGELLAEAVEPTGDGGYEGGVAGAGNHGGIAKEPRRIPAELPFGADVWAGAEDDEKAFPLGFADELRNIILAGEIEDARRRLMQVPEDVGFDGIEAHGAGFA